MLQRKYDKEANIKREKENKKPKRHKQFTFTRDNYSVINNLWRI